MRRLQTLLLTAGVHAPAGLLAEQDLLVGEYVAGDFDRGLRGVDADLRLELVGVSSTVFSVKSGFSTVGMSCSSTVISMELRSGYRGTGPASPAL